MFKNNLVVEFLRGEDADKIRLICHLFYVYGEEKIIVPAGFVSDGASIPRFFWRIIGSPFRGMYRDAAIVHDWLYFSGKYTRLETDRIFKQAMKELGVSAWRRGAMYRAVRIGGANSWQRYRNKTG